MQLKFKVSELVSSLTEYDEFLKMSIYDDD